MIEAEDKKEEVEMVSEYGKISDEDFKKGNLVLCDNAIEWYISILSQLKSGSKSESVDLTRDIMNICSVLFAKSREKAKIVG